MRGILFGLLVVWILGCTYCYVCHIKDWCYNDNSTVGAVTNNTNAESFLPFSVRDGAFSALANTGPLFAKSGDQAELSADANTAFSKIANHLKSNPGKILNINAHYTANEQYSGSAANLGVARAEAIKNAIVRSGAGLASRIRTTGTLNNRLKFINGRTNASLNCNFAAGSAAPVNNTANLGTFVAKDGNLNVNVPYALFDRSASAPDMKPPFKNGLKQIANHLKTNPDKLLTITGEYKQDEKNYSWFENLGKARAESIKKAILNSGVNGLDGDQIATVGRMNNGLSFNGDKTNGNIRCVFGKYTKADNKAALEKTYADMGKRLKAQPKNFYFDSGSSQIALDEEMRTYFRELKQYLNYYPNEKVNLTGHTDSDGDAGANKNLGQKRANLIKDYMVRNGIKVAQIKTNSRGEEAPIATNDTAEGKAKNRRVEISL